MFIPYTPKYPLSLFIDCLWRVKGQTATGKEKILPTEHMELIINFGGYHRAAMNPSNPEHFQINKEAWIVGLHTQHLLVESLGNSDMIGIRFKPGGGSAFFDFSMKELESKIIDMSLIWKSFIHEVRERVYEEENINNQFLILEELLLKKLKYNKERFKIISPALDELNEMQSNTSTQFISRKIGVSQKHLIQKFNENIGLTPNKLLRVLRFHQVLNSIDPSKDVSWLEVALTNQYYDQAHFNKDFQAFTGMSPTEYISSRKEIYGEELQKGEDVKFVPLNR
ncbi:helix-turn-helix domain-containing protein [Chengkuizengella axinellae]|uniref:Helix-turn-helix domain-containing protein n=1 Tax=Chengkuizengella axinellae TaxID=3064388 RepID=A0ABT9J215_9BACL|nr:helix-turn-helix domain-containing protein [Chengkuizengella sp. 2205SS18-9]MDP5275647.1 helix-turn-helix domain-containing protein [Chengkuizengella sp. 2205SS18-9]